MGLTRVGGAVKSDRIFDTVADMVASKTVKVGDIVETAGYTSVNDGGGALYRIVAAGTGTDDGGSFHDLDTHQAQLLNLDNPNIKAFGIVGDGSTDNTSAYTALINAVDDGTTIRFPAGTYVGNFVSETKAFKLKLGKAVFKNSSNSEDVIRFGAKTLTEYAVTETTLNHKDVQFTVTGASGLFSVGDIGYLWDSATRTGGQAVNYETVKIKSIVGDVVTVTGFLASHKGAGAIKFYHSTAQLKNVTVEGGYITPNNTHTGRGVATYNVEKVYFENIATENTTGPAISARYCYDVVINNTSPVLPNDTGSGNGYGVALWAVSVWSVENIFADGCRHAFDADSSYFGVVKNVIDGDDKAACAMLAHNGFGSYIDCEVVRTSSVQYPVYLSSAGYGGPTAALKGNHPFRSVRVTTVDNIVKESVSPNSSNVPGVYFQNSAIDCVVDGVHVVHQNTDAFTGTSNSAVVRVDGIIDGASEFKNISVDKINYILFSNGDRATLPTNANKFKLGNVNANEVRKIALLQGGQSLCLNAVDVKTTVVDDSLVLMQDVGGDNPVYFSHRDVSYPAAADKLIVDTDGFVIEGSMPQLTRSSGSNVDVAGGAAVTKADIANRTGYCKLLSTVGSGTDNVTLPLPDVNGQELLLVHAGGSRYDISVGVSTTLFTAFTMTSATPFAKLVSYSNKWQLTGQW